MQKLGRDRLAAADRDYLNPRRNIIFALRNIFRLRRIYTHKRVYIRLYPVSVEKLAESVEPELFEKSFVILGHFAALDSENRRAGTFPVADRLRETDEENHSLRIVRHGGIEYIKTFSVEPRLRMKFAQTGDRKIKA